MQVRFLSSAVTMRDCTKTAGWKAAQEKTRLFYRKVLEKNSLRYNKKPKRCLCCNVPLPYEKRRNRYCSHSCAGTVNSTGIDRWTKKRQRRYWKKRKCLNCGCVLTKEQKKFCSTRCSGKYRKKSIDIKIEKGKVDKIAPRRIKAYLVYKEGNICSLCKRKTWRQKPIPLVLDHIDGNSENNALPNLRLVCGNCDMQLSTYKGRYARKLRYAQGKSY